MVDRSAPSRAQQFVLDTFDRYHNRAFLSPDPLEVVWTYSDSGDREIAALVCSSLALGRVNAILEACRRVLGAFPNLRRDLAELSRREISLRLGNVVYRFFGNTELTNFLAGIGRVVGWYGSLEACFAGGVQPGATVWAPAAGFSGELAAAAEGRLSILLPMVEKGGASKRLNLFLRWMVRSDQIDPGGWSCLRPRDLAVPVDTHLLKAARLLGMTTRKTADRKASEEITAWLRSLRPGDPTAFDFSLTRYGIHPVLRRQGALDSALADLPY
ncbi:MAG: TIGR02757 family protein [Spirochaetaceae bacterium]